MPNFMRKSNLNTGRTVLGVALGAGLLVAGGFASASDRTPAQDPAHVIVHAIQDVARVVHYSSRSHQRYGGYYDYDYGGYYGGYDRHNRRGHHNSRRNHRSHNDHGYRDRGRGHGRKHRKGRGDHERRYGYDSHDRHSGDQDGRRDNRRDNRRDRDRDHKRRSHN